MPEKPLNPSTPSAGGPRYLRLANQLRRWFHTGTFSDRQPLPSLRTLATQFSVGLQVVRQAVQQLESEGILVRNARNHLVLASDSGTARGIRDIVAIIQSYGPSINPDMGRVINGLLGKLAFLNLPALVLHGRIQLRHGLPPDLLDLPLKGILLFGQFSDRGLRHYEKLKVPVVLVDQPSSSSALRSISVDNVAAARDATERIIAMGHRRIGLLRFLPLSVAKIDPDSRERQRGFSQAAEEAGLSQADARVYTRSGAEMVNSRTIRRLLSERPRITALLTVDSISAQIVAETAASMGVSVPEDLSIVTFHSMTMRGEREWSGPCADFEELGREAVSLLTASHPPQPHLRIKPTWENGRTLTPPKS